jgi:mono/diheme cytochrome c family protein
MKRICCAIVCTLSLGLCCAQDLSSLQRGKLLYRGSTALTQAPTVHNVAMPANVTACASCHGLSGQGGQEAGTVAPPITTRALLLPRVGGKAYESVHEALTGLAIGQGRMQQHGRATLLANMPRYALTTQELQDLTVYIQVLGTQQDDPAGISAQRIRVATLLPVNGAMQLAAQEVEAGLRSEIKLINAHGGIYGRSLELWVQPLHGPSAADYRQAMAELAQKDVYALVGAWQPPYDANKPSPLPMVASLGFAATQAQARAQHYLLPSLQDQINDLVRYVETECSTKNSSLTLLHNGHSSVMEALAQTKLQQRSDVKLVNVTASPMVHTVADTINQRIISLGVSMPTTNSTQAKPACTAQLAALSGIPQAGALVADKQLTLLPIPPSLMQTGDTPFWTRMGSLAAQLLGDTLSRSGRQLDEQSLQRIFDSVDKFELGSDLSASYSKKTVPGLRSTLMISGGSYVSYSN